MFCCNSFLLRCLNFIMRSSLRLLVLDLCAFVLFLLGINVVKRQNNKQQKRLPECYFSNNNVKISVVHFVTPVPYASFILNDVIKKFDLNLKRVPE